MPIEREDKWLLKETPNIDLGVTECIAIDQFYLVRNGTLTQRCRKVFKIKSIEITYWMTSKFVTDEGIIEVEHEISKENYDEYQLFMIGKMIVKDRYNWYGWEIDIFKEQHEGLIIAELEFPDGKVFKYEVPKEFGEAENVTDDRQYSNASLADA